MFKVEHFGNFKNTERFFKDTKALDYMKLLKRYGNAGVAALSRATPRDTGETSQAWTYAINRTRRGYSIVWSNSNMNGGVPIVILLQHGHATGGGGYVQGRDFINPAIRPIVDRLSKEIWQEVLDS